ncbi:Hexose transporter HXT15 [Cocos nucifera]|uniref:Hexose transporter HXT15 n=1 Tax=Cocos nucifera TaxID=13894 RepID=A0A8K0MXC5_COCNU|nr:Hexose transporter HXT15 [Cocos nucifera]
MAVHLLLSSPPKPPPQNPNPNCDPKFCPKSCQRSKSRREVSIQALTISMVSLTPWFFVPTALLASLETSAPPRKPSLSGISNTKSWNQFFGDGFSIRVPPLFEDIMEPEDYKSGLSYYGDKAKPKTFAARFASPDRSEVLSVVIRPSNQLKITFLEAKDITDLGTLKEAAKIFVPGSANLYSARTIKVKEDESLRTYYFYEFGVDAQHVALVATVNSGKMITSYTFFENGRTVASWTRFSVVKLYYWQQDEMGMAR